MAGTLFVVATPIGNLEDITMRALRVLREANLVAAEDTRRTSKLLNHYGIRTPTLSFHVHNSRTRLPQLLDRLTRRTSPLQAMPAHPAFPARGRVVAALPPARPSLWTLPGPSAAVLAAVV
jgi:16S rRNA (cytidine1402-2'-O)-methyltransferase